MRIVFHVDTGRLSLPDRELADAVAQISPEDHSRAAKFARGLAVALRDDTGVDLGSRDASGLHVSELVHTGDLLAAAASSAAGEQVAARLAELAGQVRAFAMGVTA
jgi:hypothetical protein